MFYGVSLLYWCVAILSPLLTLGTVVGVVIYTGRELRSVMNTSNPRNKVQ